MLSRCRHVEHIVAQGFVDRRDQELASALRAGGAGEDDSLDHDVAQPLIEAAVLRSDLA